MKLEIVPTSRIPRLPLAATIAVVVWVTFGAFICVLNGYMHVKMELCPMKRLTGLPCPTCGSTRGALSVLEGHAVRGFLYNPLVFTALGLVALDLAGRAAFGKRLRLSLAKRERAWGYVLVLSLLALDWLWVYFYVETGRVAAI